MIPRYFRCGEPSGNCPISVSREIVKEERGWQCPCNNPDCERFRETVGLLDGLTGGRSRMVWVALGLVLLLAAALFVFGSRDPTARTLADLRQRLASLETEVATLEGQPPVGNGKPSPVDVSSYRQAAVKLQQEAKDALESRKSDLVSDVHRKVQEQSESIRKVLQSLEQPGQGGGVQSAQAMRVVGKLQALDQDAEAALEDARLRHPGSVPAFEAFLADVEGLMERTRRAAAPKPTADAGAAAAKPQLGALMKELDVVRKQLQDFVPPPDLPFPPDKADLRVIAVGSLASDLVAPLMEAWSGAALFVASEDTWLFPQGKGKQGNAVLRKVRDGEGFDLLAQGGVDVFFSDREPGTAESSRLGPSYIGSRSVAEVVALDALTLLVHPESPADVFELERPGPWRMLAGAVGSDVRRQAEWFALGPFAPGADDGERAALGNREALALGLYHREGANLRAKRMAVKASAEAMALKPSPFTIATEDYRFSCRIVAWTRPQAGNAAHSLVKFTTSDEGQKLVEKHGYVDLRLRPMEGDVPPEIMAALGAALGVERVNSAVRISTNFRFQVGDDKLDLKAQADLERLPRFIASSFPNHKLVILGFTDADGGPGINMPLSQRRAETVAAELRKSGVDTRSGGLGSAFPVDSNLNPAGKARNRRAEVWAVKP